MKERPILFSGPMVRAILCGRKTQTRRVVKESFNVDRVTYGCIGGQGFGFIFGNKVVRCPYGELGDRLWVKETHFEARKWRHAPLFAAAPDFIYRADCELRSVIGCHHWKPSIFMKRESSRITLEIVSVRVERLQEISEADAMAEGIEPKQMPTGEVVYNDHLGTEAKLARPVSSYATLWDSINGIGAWATNPWVWVVEFKKL